MMKVDRLVNGYDVERVCFLEYCMLSSNLGRGRQMHALGLCGPKNNCKKPLIKLVPVRYPKEKPIGVIMSHQRPLNVEWPVVIFRKGVSDQKVF
ncbi:unnamed protein product [Acanthoscelides obtectus]|uniref:Uncharacterized protein n=1 Tax=Acanthoscelides obtectus TaxID=200917 RepID=A0A9P0PJ14_ACAOB|nr:unnamed protein product [Acanthoscelides obtectus]CAK1677735.1 hypothetical protein AOBTE_LOCUS31522 [Acanthoscelides obtectus]